VPLGFVLSNGQQGDQPSQPKPQGHQAKVVGCGDGMQDDPDGRGHQQDQQWFQRPHRIIRVVDTSLFKPIAKVLAFACASAALNAGWAE
jgi:hypothetical protein